MDSFPKELSKSIAFQIKLFFLTNSQMFTYFMFPIMENLLEMLKFLSDEKKNAIFSFDDLEKDKVLTKIVENCCLYINGNIK